MASLMVSGKADTWDFLWERMLNHCSVVVWAMKKDPVWARLKDFEWVYELWHQLESQVAL